MGNAISGQSVWLDRDTRLFAEVVAVLCDKQVHATLTLADGRDRSGELHEMENAELWFRPNGLGDVSSSESYEGIPLEEILAIRVW